MVLVGLWVRRLARGGVVTLMVVVGAAASLLMAPEAERKRRSSPLDDMVGHEAPGIADEVVEWLNGEEVELRRLRGRTVLLVFWHPRDGGKSEAELPNIVRIARKYEPRGLVTIGLCVCDDATDIDPLISTYDIPFRIALDCDADAHQDDEKGYLIDKKGTPYCYLVDGSQRVVWGAPAQFLADRVIEEYLSR